MAEDPVPDEIKQFILRHIDSIGQLEALLLLRGKPDEAWNVGAVARRLYIHEQEAAPILSRLTKRGFLVADASEPTAYKYQPESVELRQMIDRLADIYSKHLVPVTNLIHNKPRTRIQEFADAFKLGKEE
jgi:hypothetical protein